MSFGVKRIGMDHYNFLYKNMPRDTFADFEVFNGKRTVEVYRGKGYMNKITKKLGEKNFSLIRHMVNKGTEKNPDLRDCTYQFRGPGGEAVVYINDINGIDKPGITLNMFRHGYVPFLKNYDSIADMRTSKGFLDRIIDITHPLKSRLAISGIDDDI